MSYARAGTASLGRSLMRILDTSLGRWVRRSPTLRVPAIAADTNGVLSVTRICRVRVAGVAVV